MIITELKSNKIMQNTDKILVANTQKIKFLDQWSIKEIK